MMRRVHRHRLRHRIGAGLVRGLVAGIWLAGPAAMARAGEPAAEQSCVDVRIGAQQFYDCLNRQLRKSVPAPPSARGGVASAAGISAPAAGTYNQAATQQRLGNAFGHSVVPQRPPPLVYGNPMLPQVSR